MDNLTDVIDYPTGSSAHAVRSPIPVDTIRMAVYRCRQNLRNLLLPHQQQDELAIANDLTQRLADAAPTDTHLNLDGDERGFTTLWTADPRERLNGTQRLALEHYRGGRYASAQLATEIMGADNGLAYALIQHLQATSDPSRAQHQLSRTFARFCSVGETMRESMNATLSASAEDAPMQHDTGPAAATELG